MQRFLGKAIDPPKVQAIEKALSILEELGAIDYEGHLTALGRQMVRLYYFRPLSVSNLSQSSVPSSRGSPSRQDDGAGRHIRMSRRYLDHRRMPFVQTSISQSFREARRSEQVSVHRLSQRRLG